MKTPYYQNGFIIWQEHTQEAPLSALIQTPHEALGRYTAPKNEDRKDLMTDTQLLDAMIKHGWAIGTKMRGMFATGYLCCDETEEGFTVIGEGPSARKAIENALANVSD